MKGVFVAERGLRAFWRRLVARLARVTAVSVGREDDGLVLARGGGPNDRDWGDLSRQFSSALDAWRQYPLARRIIGITTSYVVGDGITLTSDRPALRRYLDAWWHDPNNLFDLRLAPWSDELARSGELFVVLHFNRASGVSYARLVPASCIDRITWAPGDYERELTYHEVVGPDDPDYAKGGREWLAVGHPEADEPLVAKDGLHYKPVMLHFAVNRPAGCVRGDSDLASILSWLKRYDRWVEDRVRLNAAVRAFLWIVRVPASNLVTRSAELRTPPEAGQVVVVDRDAEDWQAIAPNLHATDAAADGRVIRWMVVAGGPGIGLTDVGEAESANLATARAMADQRSRFLKLRQSYFGYVLARLGLESYNRAVRLGRWRGQERTLQDIRIGFSDVSVSDNAELGQAASNIATALQTLGELGVKGNAFQRLATRLVLRFAGEQMSEADLDKLLSEVGWPTAGD